MNRAYYWYRPHPVFGPLFLGKILNPITDPTIYVRTGINSSQLKLVKKYFLDGLSPHGIQALQDYDFSDHAIIEPIDEIIFELVRQLCYPNEPSRLSSLYASESLAQAEQWQKLWLSNFQEEDEQTAKSLWEIEFETRASLHDATFLNIPNADFSYLTALDNAHRYWQGELTKEPLPELLIPYPVKVVRMIRNLDNR